LLKFQIAIGGHKNFKTCIRSTSKQLAVPQPGPSLLLDRVDLVPAQFRGKVAGQLFIEQDAHRPSKPHVLPQGPRSLALAKPMETRRETHRDCAPFKIVE